MMHLPYDWIAPDWPAPPQVRACTTTRSGGMSDYPFDSMNLADHVGDDPIRVAANRRRLEELLGLPAPPAWLQQVHGVAVQRLTASLPENPPRADAAITDEQGVVCTVLTADCLPVLLCDRQGTRVAAVHAGWRGLAEGVLEATVQAMGVAGDRLLAWLGPAIGAQDFEVGEEVRAAFEARDPWCGDAFRPARDGRWWADLYTLARRRLHTLGITAVYGGQWCTYSDARRFYSYRRDGETGRMASLIWLVGH